MEKTHLFLLLLLSNLLLQSLSEKSNGVCVSPGGRFSPFSSEGKSPRKVRDLTLCRVFQRKTCCDASNTHLALLSIRKLASTGEANQDCLQLWELLDCSICDPNIGVKPGPPLICPSFCDRLYQACSDAYFSMDTISQAAGFAVQPTVGSGLSIEETSCYGGKVSLDSIAEPWKSSPSRTSGKDIRYLLLDDFKQWMRDMPFTEQVSWAVGGLVLTAGLLFISKRKSYRQQKKNAAAIRVVRIRKLDADAGRRSKGISKAGTT